MTTLSLMDAVLQHKDLRATSMEEQYTIGKNFGLSERGREYAVKRRTPDGRPMSEYFAQQLLNEETWPVTYEGKRNSLYIFVTTQGETWNLKYFTYFEPWKDDIDVQTFKSLIGGE